MLMQQLPLDLAARPRPSFDNFVPGANAAALAALRAAAQAAPPAASVYLWGPEGSGRSHLLAAYAEATGAAVLGPESTAAAFDAAERAVVDDCERLDPAQQERLFHLYNRVRDAQGCLVASGNAAPLYLPLREDLRTRLGWGLVFQLQPLSDAEKVAALAGMARDRGLKLSDDVLPYILTRFERDLRGLEALIDALDRYSLQHQRAVTLPLLKDLLKERVNESGPV